jgi:hypothetical protein
MGKHIGQSIQERYTVRKSHPVQLPPSAKAVRSVKAIKASRQRRQPLAFQALPLPRAADEPANGEQVSARWLITTLVDVSPV